MSVGTILGAQVTIAVSRSTEFAAARTVVEEAQRNPEDDAEVNLATGLLMVNVGMHCGARAGPASSNGHS